MWVIVGDITVKHGSTPLSFFEYGYIFFNIVNCQMFV